MKSIFLITIILTCSVGALAAPNDIIKVFQEKTKIENPFDLRDPFNEPSIKKDESQESKPGYQKSGEGNYTNIVSKDPGSLTVQDIRVVGVLIGKERRALIKMREGASEVIILKEGMKIGPEQGELKAILPGGVIIVEKIVNVYGQEEYLETVIPISR
jgi:hypothetical protein